MGFNSGFKGLTAQKPDILGKTSIISKTHQALDNKQLVQNLSGKLSRKAKSTAVVFDCYKASV